MDPYEDLANAIIIQAADDYRNAARFLRKHPRTKELEETVAGIRAEKSRKREERKRLKLPNAREQKSREEILLDKIVDNETLLFDVKKFFRSDWFSKLTSVDGEILLAKLEKEAE
ncbi:MAG: hypothetical protein IJU05_04920 [Schwartzia sp.]|nr:hypothetical protein [Schwartzia sp. (in: firmicutes)]